MSGAEFWVLTDHTYRAPLPQFRPDLLKSCQQDNSVGTPEAILNAAPDLRECYRAIRNENIARQAQERGVAYLSIRAVAALLNWRDSRAALAVEELTRKGWLLHDTRHDTYTVNP